VQPAIGAVEGARSRTLPTLPVMRAGIKTLYGREPRLEQLVTRESRGTDRRGDGVPLG
jgi:hypothetical protein